MKTLIKNITMAVLLGFSAWSIAAQVAPSSGDAGPPPGQGPGAPGGPGGGRHRRPLPPIINALDANHDGVIDASEIANASAALLTLDKNGDGKLTIDELMGPRPNRGGTNGPADNSAGDRPHPPLPLAIAALDANHDGVIDASEIANASAVLAKLDKDGDGKLTILELMGPRPRGPHGGGGPGDRGNDGPGDHNGPPGSDGRPPSPPPGDN